MTRTLLQTLLLTALLSLGALAAFEPAAARSRGASSWDRIQAAPGTLVTFEKQYPAGSIIVVNKERKLYYVLGHGRALRYPIAIGTPRNQWTGKSFVQRKAKDPSWTPPWNQRRTVPGGPGNPLGKRAIYLDWGLYRIHGTNAPGSIGRAASHGCIRMHNKHVIDLYERVHIGAPVFVIRSL